jgi:prepilin-type N-terminal cleavage/methylation domain-containing protein/prepilin-type processing-associated H-X9-DG protein
MGRQKAMKSQVRTGFTLVELLVVIAIISVLAALLFPVFNSARRKAWQTTCLSNQRQIGAALMLYLQDFDETYPNIRFEPLGDQSAGTLEENSWRVVISPYLRNIAVMICPANPDNHILSQDGKYPISYAANFAANPRDIPLPSLLPLNVLRTLTFSGVFGHYHSPGVKASSIVRPAECIAVVEMAHYQFTEFTVDLANDGAPFGDGGNGIVVCFADCLFTGHFGQSNYLFTDGHVKSLKPKATYRGNEVNYWYRDATSLGDEARTTLAKAEAHNE